MAAKTTKKVIQQPILNSDVESTAPDKNNVQSTSIISKSRRRTSLEEFALTKNLRPEIQAGFKAWLKGQYFHFESEWEELFESYTNRQL